MSNVCFRINNRDLKIEQILVELDYPVLYVCIDDYATRYLAMCVDSYEGYYLIAEIKSSVVYDMLEGTITMREAFEKAVCIYSVEAQDNSCLNDIVKPVSFSDIEDEDLPEIGARFDAFTAEICKYQKKLKDADQWFSYKVNINGRPIVFSAMDYAEKSVFKAPPWRIDIECYYSRSNVTNSASNIYADQSWMSIYEEKKEYVYE